jgi:hypothetical protein
MRKLIDGNIVPEHEDVITITIRTHCPDKWRFVDLETGDVWKRDVATGHFRRGVVPKEVIRDAG